MAKASIIAARQANNLVELNERVAALEAKVDQLLVLVQALTAAKAPKPTKAKADDNANVH